MAEKTSIITADGIELAGVYARAAAPRGAVLCLHMMPATKESWAAFSAALNGLGLSTLAIDLRGHGESVRMGAERLDYRAFSDAEHQQTHLDVEAAAAWLIAKEGISFGRMALAGASIGANLAIGFASVNWEITAVLALSPGLNYHGVTTDAELAGMKPSQAIFLAASEEDAYAYSCVQELAKMPSAAVRTVRLLKDAGHGTTMFERDQAFMHEAAGWLADRIPPRP